MLNTIECIDETLHQEGNFSFSSIVYTFVIMLCDAGYFCSSLVKSSCISEIFSLRLVSVESPFLHMIKLYRKQKPNEKCSSQML